MKRLVNILPGLLLTASLMIQCQSPDSASIPDQIDYNQHIRPILSDKCFKCHGPDARQRKSDLRLDLPEGAYAALKNSPEMHAIIPGDPLKSAVYLRISSTDTSEIMPPPGTDLELTATEIQLIRKWIEQGAVYQKHWAFIPPVLPAIPEQASEWPSNPIDNFILSKMKLNNLKPNPESDKARLLKRLCFDLTGLPPTPEIVKTFLQDTSPDAYEKQVDRLLADPHYGEKMAIHWLDVARYADTHGYQDDGLRTMWPWRDWVIHAFNKNYGYDKFLGWQLAGDQYPNPTSEMILATGFNRNHKITQEGGVIDEEYRIEYVTDRTNTFGKAFLALTFECAKCHDHKYDPIAQKDYFGTFAFFNQVAEKGYQGDIYSGTPADPPRLTLTTEDLQGILSFINKKDSGVVKVMVMRDSSRIRPTYVLQRGVYDAPGERVKIHLPEAILPYDSLKYGHNRYGLVKWLLDERNPLTARVFVNRIWQEFFGRGLVKTSGDFGMQGDLPSHPELLDWLAVDFRTHQWDIKRLVKIIVMSSTYRQSAAITSQKLAIDPDNIYLSRAPRLRLSAELIRDHVLASSGLLVPEIGGPSVKPYQPKGIWEVATSGRGLTRYVQDHESALYRRGMYTFIKRTVPPPAQLIFDGSSRDQCEVKRTSTNTPLQALVLMNDPTVAEASRVLAEKCLHSSTPAKAIQDAFIRIICREPTNKELTLLNSYFENERQQLSPERVAQLISAGEAPHVKVSDVNSLAALIETIMTIYNLDEAITKS